MDPKKLSPELREKAKECKTPEEMLKLAKEEGYELSDEDKADIEETINTMKGYAEAQKVSLKSYIQTIYGNTVDEALGWPET